MRHFHFWCSVRGKAVGRGGHEDRMYVEPFVLMESWWRWIFGKKFQSEALLLRCFSSISRDDRMGVLLE